MQAKPNTKRTERPARPCTGKTTPFAVCFLTAGCVLLCSFAAGAAGPADSQRFFSPSVAQKFHQIAGELAGAEDISRQQAEQAIILLTAVTELDSTAAYVYPDMIKLASQLGCSLPPPAIPEANDGPSEAPGGRSYSELLGNLLVGYVDRGADLELTAKAIRCLLEPLDSREQREQLLGELLQTVGGKNDWLDSELATLLGLLTAETADANSAKSYFLLAYDKNKYNRLAFAKLIELMPEQVTAVAYLEHLRLSLVENPLDIEAALAFAQYAQNLQLYDTAAGAWQYCADLFKYLRPTQPLPPYIYLPWAISAYNMPRNQHQTLQIAEELRQAGRFDLILETVAARAAEKTGRPELANRILRQAEEKAIQTALTDQKYTDYQQLAWFYCFADTDAGKALDWANKAYSAEPNSPATAGILACALVMNQQTDWAKLLIENYQTNPIADLATAQIQLAAGQRDSAIQTLKSVIAAGPGSLEAERARQILAQHDAEYIPPVEPGIVLTALKSNFSYPVVPEFVNPAEVISARLKLRGTEFSYGNDFSAFVAITNNSSQPLVITDTSLFKGNIRVDARLSGDLAEKIPNLVSLKIRPSSAIEPAATIIVPLRLLTGRLRRTLLSSPQASLNIEFTLTLDPLTGDQEKPVSALGLAPAALSVKRAGVKLDTKFLQNRLDSLSKGRQGQKIRAVRLFAGLLAEQQQMAVREPAYKFKYGDWMPDLLKSALLSSLTTDDWVVRVHTMADMAPLPLDFDLVNAVSENLNDTDHWPARLMALYLLAKKQDTGFTRVLDWTAEYDSSTLVRRMAIALGASVPKLRQTANQPASEI